MAKKKTKSPDQEGGTTIATSDTTNLADLPISRYFKVLFESRPDLLELRSNDDIYKIWLADHPNTKEVPQSVKQGLSNVKSSMRQETGTNPKRKKGKKRKGKKAAANGAAAPAPVRVVKASTGQLELLEILIDDSILLARKIGGSGLDKALDFLRKARIQIGLKLGS